MDYSRTMKRLLVVVSVLFVFSALAVDPHKSLSPAGASQYPAIRACDSRVSFIKFMDPICSDLSTYYQGSCFHNALTFSADGSKSLVELVISTCGDNVYSSSECLKKTIQA